MTVALVVIAVVVMVAASGFLAASETAVGVYSRADLEELAGESRVGGAIRKIAAAPEEHVNALTFTRVVLETMSAVAVSLLLAQLFGEWWLAFVVAVGVMMLVSFLLTSASPRSVARAHPRSVLGASAPLVRVVRIVLGPLAQLLVAVGDRVTPGRPARAASVTSEEQLLSMVDEAVELDVLEEDDRALIHSVFDFSDRLVREVMVARTDVTSIDADASLPDALEVFLRQGFSRAPLIGRDGDDVRGVVYFKDLVAHAMQRAEPQPTLADIARPATFVPESLAAGELLRQMQRRSVHLAIVIDEYGGVAGLVTLEDLIEELVGEISDEFDRGDVQIKPLGDGLYRVASRLTVDELGELFDEELEDDDVDSVGGLIAKELGKVPESGDVAIVGGLRLDAERAGRRGRVTTVLARRATVAELRERLERDGPVDEDVIEHALRRRRRDEQQAGDAGGKERA